VVKLAANTAVTIALNRIGTPAPTQPAWPLARTFKPYWKIFAIPEGMKVYSSPK
jgi:hypothetical protein